MNNLDQIISSLLAQQPALHDADELTDRIMLSLPEQTAIRSIRRWAVAASVAALFCLGVAAAGAFYIESAKVQDTEITPALTTSAPKPDFFVFDNVEMEQVAATLGKHYRLTPVFENEATKHKRLYFRVEKDKSIQEIAELISSISNITVTVRDGKLIIK